MENKSNPVAPKAPPPREGIVYARIVSWILVVGVIISLVGLIIYIPTGGEVNTVSLLDYLWQGCDCHTIWSELAGGISPLSFSLGTLSHGDGLAMLGITISCLAAVIGMWGLSFQMMRRKGRLYLVFAVIISIVLTLSVLGLINLE